MNDPLASITQEPPYRDRIRELTDFWHLEDSPRARWVMNLPSAGLPLLKEDLSFPDFFRDRDLQLREQLWAVQWAQELGLDDLYVPHLQPQAGVTIFASAFGCLIDFPELMYPRSFPVIRSGDPAAHVYDLPRPSISDGQLGQMLDLADYFANKTDRRYPIQMTDVQSPVDTAYLVWDSISFMMAMYDHPQEVHHIMRLVTDLTIDFIKAHQARAHEFVPVHYPAIWMPEELGVALSDDALAVLSPQTYEEFALPYTNEISEEFGGVVIHSCGSLTHQFGVLKKVHKLRGINFGASETPFEAVWEHFNGKTAIVPHTGLNKDIHFETQLDYVRHILQVKTHNQGLLIVVDPRKICGERLSAPMLQEVSDEINLLLDGDAKMAS